MSESGQLSILVLLPARLYMSEPFRRNIQCIGFYCSGESTSPVYGSESGSGLCIIEPFVRIYSVLVSTVLAKAPHMCIGWGQADTLYMIELFRRNIQCSCYYGSTE